MTSGPQHGVTLVRRVRAIPGRAALMTAGQAGSPGASRVGVAITGRPGAMTGRTSAAATGAG
ncbi:MAG TPA: hypothetical protein VGH27_22870 [Streptosporangiaceae bacterium]